VLQLATIRAAAGRDVRFSDEEQFCMAKEELRKADVICVLPSCTIGLRAFFGGLGAVAIGGSAFS
jgi:hypothetical protein